MSCVHTTGQAGEMAFMDSSWSLDWYNNPVQIMCTHHPCGALPLAVWVTSTQSQSCPECCLKQLKAILPSHTFGGKGPEKGPDIFLSDATSESPLETGNTPLMHQATWQWLVNSKCTISKDDKQDLMSIMQDLVSAKTPRIWRNQGPSCIRHYFTEISSVSRIFVQSYREEGRNEHFVEEPISEQEVTIQATTHTQWSLFQMCCSRKNESLQPYWAILVHHWRPRNVLPMKASLLGFW